MPRGDRFVGRSAGDLVQAAVDSADRSWRERTEFLNQLSPKKLPRFRRGYNANASEPQSKQQAKYSSETNAGHLIADTFGGANDVRNLIPMNAKLNQSGGAWRIFEQTWLEKTCFANSSPVRKKAYMKVKVSYPRRSKADQEDDPLPSYIPSSFLVTLTLYSRAGNTPIVHSFRFKNTADGRSKDFPPCDKPG
jgi:hypothetical protein